MIFYPAVLVQFLIVGALILTGVAAAALLVMVLVDFIRKQVW